MKMIDIKSLNKDIDLIKPFPSIARRAISMLNNTNEAEIKDISNIIKKDQVITAKILRSANSLAFGGIRDITTVNEAIARLGFYNVTQIILYTCTKGYFDKAGKYQIEEKGLWSHSIATADMCEIIIKYKDIKGIDAEEAFVSGLLHDIGKIVLAKYLNNDFEYLRRYSIENKLPFYEAEKHILGFSHAEISEMIMKKWSIPDSIIICAKYHHTPEDLSKNYDNILLDIVCLADSLVDSMGIGMGYDKTDISVNFGILDKLHISEEDICNLQQAFLEINDDDISVI